MNLPADMQAHIDAIRQRTAIAIPWPSTKKVDQAFRDNLTDMEAVVVWLKAAQCEPPPLPPLPPQTDGVVLEPTDDLQRAFNESTDRTFLLRAGQTYVRPEIVLNEKGGLIRTLATLPERRITPADLPLLATISAGGPSKTIKNDMETVRRGITAKGWTLAGVHFPGRDDGLSEVVSFEHAEGITLDRVIVLGGAKGQKRGVRLNGSNMWILQSHIANCWSLDGDAQAVLITNGAGPYRLTDCFLEGGGENVMVGGEDNEGFDFIPSDGVIYGCEFFKPAAWRNSPHGVKNLLEFKCGRRWKVSNCSFDGCWPDAQSGWSILIKVDNQGGNPWQLTEDITLENCDVRNVTHGINLLGSSYEHGPSQQMRGVVIRNIRLHCDGDALQAGGEVLSAEIGHCDFTYGNKLMTLYTGGVLLEGQPWREAKFAIGQLSFHNNLCNGAYGVKGDATGWGQPSLDAFIQSLSWQDNAILGAAGIPYPPTTYFDLASVPPGVVVGR